MTQALRSARGRVEHLCRGRQPRRAPRRWRAGETVDLVYIDPPYNTGSSFAYRDDFRAARHDPAAWVEMMRPRLEAAREVIAETGAIFVSIDDNERPGSGC